MKIGVKSQDIKYPQVGPKKTIIPPRDPERTGIPKMINR